MLQQKAPGLFLLFLEVSTAIQKASFFLPWVECNKECNFRFHLPNTYSAALTRLPRLFLQQLKPWDIGRKQHFGFGFSSINDQNIERDWNVLIAPSVTFKGCREKALSLLLKNFGGQSVLTFSSDYIYMFCSQWVGRRIFKSNFTYFHRSRHHFWTLLFSKESMNLRSQGIFQKVSLKQTLFLVGRGCLGNRRWHQTRLNNNSSNSQGIKALRCITVRDVPDHEYAKAWQKHVRAFLY